MTCVAYRLQLFLTQIFLLFYQTAYLSSPFFILFLVLIFFEFTLLAVFQSFILLLTFSLYLPTISPRLLSLSTLFLLLSLSYRQSLMATFIWDMLSPSALTLEWRRRTVVSHTCASMIPIPPKRRWSMSGERVTVEEKKKSVCDMTKTKVSLISCDMIISMYRVSSSY